MLTFEFEKQYDKFIIGVDEVGRGPLAGPVVAATCYFPDPKNKLINLNYFNDSKLLTTKKRIICYNHILELKKLSLVKFTIGEASVLEIDSINILQASLLAMKRAIIKANNKEATFLIDGSHIPKIENNKCINVIRGDRKSISIAAASVVAKIYRDNIMEKLSKNFPFYDWENNMGYGTKSHINMIKTNGITKHHRKTFKPIASFIHNNS